MATPNPASAIGFAWCDQSPCYRDLVPGQTRWTPTLAEFNRYLLTQADPYHLSLWPSADGKFLDMLVLPLSENAHVTAADIVQLYGIPCRVDISVWWKWSTVTLQYSQLEAQIATDGQHLYPDSRVQYVTLRTVRSSLARLSAKFCTHDPSSSLVPGQWQGFTSLQHYLTTP